MIEDIGTVAELETDGDGSRMRIASRLGGELEPGDSVAINGICLTALETDRAGFVTEAMNQTLRLTSLGSLQHGDRVNLELAVLAGARLGGHLVQGHVDGVAEVTEAEDDGIARRLRLRIDPDLARLGVEQGSVALDGVSLTISALGDDWLEVSLIPQTLLRTNLGDAEPGQRLNVECDLVGKYVERLMAPFVDKEGARDDG